MDFDQGHLNQDELYQACVSFILETRQVSISGLQRQFNLDYNRTAR
ncbi:MAG: DNA translocase FtsK [Acinetobacter sp.]